MDPLSPGPSEQPADPTATPQGGTSSRPASRGIDDALQREIDEALGDMDVKEFLEMAPPVRPATTGRAPPKGARNNRGGKAARGRPHHQQPRTERTTRTGRIVRIHAGDVFVEFGPKSQGVCPLVQFGETPPELNSDREFVLERMDAFEGLMILSLPGATQKADWDNLEVGQVVEARCVGMNKGGLEMEVAHHKAFMPAGQVDLRHIPDISVFIGEKFPCQIIELRKDKGRIILSRRAAVAADREKRRDEILNELEVGQQKSAVITSVQPYGAFADIGGIDGLIHISDLAHERLKHAADAVKVGDEVEVKILKIDRSQSPAKISLGRKQVMSDPILQKIGEIQNGATVTGRVTRLAEFGAFVEIAPGVEGLVHISELSHDRIATVDRIVKKDQIVNAKVLSVDPDRRRVSLSMKALVERPVPKEGGRGDRNRDRDGPVREDGFLRDEDPAMRKLKAKFGISSLKGGIG